ncbi:type VI secretion system tip protein VgrG [Noviherbaspirillum cavernae]|uniref:Type VI secretion system tip protein VgrG n=1 Tax=Noviherbaspirillum cavernae TaxID=2320862 RepID=A0A418X0Y1_9BURK|nr:type VI secretion system Vgr family protein [Noviherbaspirillum cavernae]RJG06144.1 type VI secretion system tip protein VgrG [Noviherbaspirillum cavernae]
MHNVPSPASTADARLAGLIGEGRRAFSRSLSQHARLISIETPLETDALVVERFTGHEAMSELFRFEVDCLATTAHYPIKDLIGEEVSLRLLLADGSTRAFHGMAVEIRQKGSDGGLARYRLTLAPWLHALTLRRDSYVFQDKSVPEILKDIFSDYALASYRFELSTTLPRRSLTIQYRETDYDFIHRLLAEEGLNFYLEHSEDHDRDKPASAECDAASSESARVQHARHTLVVFDDNASLMPGRQPSIRFHRAAATEASDTVTLFAQRLQVQANRVALASWDYKALTAVAIEESMDAGTPDVPILETFDGTRAYRYTDTAESTRIARARSQSLAMAHQTMYGESSVRALTVGSWFGLTGHVHTSGLGNGPADAEYAVLSIEHNAASNVTAAIGGTDDAGIEAGTYRNHFTCVPRTIPIRPVCRPPKPVAPGAQVALVIGVAGAEVTTDRDHRIKVQFPWQRGDRAAPGQLNHPATSNAPGNETAGTWVRVAEPAAGANWGGSFIPRIGQEVMVGFVAGDIDRPIITGQLYNGSDAPPLHGADNHPGALAGIRSQEFAGGGFNQWLMDDTPAQLRTGVASSHASSQLNAGYLIRQNGNLRGTYRGTGFELATDAWSTVRARRGIFVTTAQRHVAASTQLDTNEAQRRLDTAADMAGALSDAATRHRAPPLATPQGTQQLRATIDGGESVDGQQAAAFTQPVTLFDSEGSASLATPASAVLFSGTDLTLTAASVMRFCGGQAASIVAAKEASLFTHAGGAKAIAANAPMSLRAHTGPMDVTADQALTLTSVNGNITLQARQDILLAAGGGFVRLGGGNIDIHCPSSVSVKGAAHDFLGAESIAATLEKMPDTRIKAFDEQFLALDKATGKPIAGLPYQIKMPDGRVLAGTTDDQGRTMRVASADQEALQLFFGPIADEDFLLDEDN